MFEQLVDSPTNTFVYRGVEPSQQGVAGMMAAFFLILGLFGGVVFAIPVSLFIENVGSYVGNRTDV